MCKAIFEYVKELSSGMQGCSETLLRCVKESRVVMVRECKGEPTCGG